MASNGKATTVVYGRWKVMATNLQPQLVNLLSWQDGTRIW